MFLGFLAGCLVLTWVEAAFSSEHTDGMQKAKLGAAVHYGVAWRMQRAPGKQAKVSNGNCENITNCKECTNTADSTVCTVCEEGYYLKKNGDNEAVTDCVGQDNCGSGYYPDTSFRECKRCDTSCTQCSGAAVTQCSECKNGYFLGAREGQEGACVACGNMNGTEWRGVEGCAECTKPESAGVATCTKCEGNKYLYQANSTTSCITACPNGYYQYSDRDGTKKCVLCSANATRPNVTGIPDCTSCSLAGTTLTCTACTDGKKPNSAKTVCNNCNVSNCVFCDSDDVCSGCEDGYTLSTDNTTCMKIPGPECTTIPSCKTCPDSATCTECQAGKYLSPLKEACLDACPSNSYANVFACITCDGSCLTCTSAGSSGCTSCVSGKMLKYTDNAKPSTGQCVDQCATGRDDCRICGTSIGDTLYCSRCSTATSIPVNGVCQTDSSRTKICTSPDGSGACNACADGYFPLEGGCYQADRLPGKEVCTATSQGKCTACTSGDPTSAGSCAIPQIPHRSALSTGAIAGISVAAVLVVGGLVGFLCWWFLRRGKVQPGLLRTVCSTVND